MASPRPDIHVDTNLGLSTVDTISIDGGTVDIPLTTTKTFRERLSSFKLSSPIKKMFGRRDSDVETVCTGTVEVLPTPVTVDEEAKGETSAPDGGDIFSHDPAAAKFKSCHWLHAGVLMVTETISLGILSLPAAIAKLGLIPGILCISTLGFLATYSGYVIGQWKLKYPKTLSFADVGEQLGGKWLGRVFGAAAIMSFVFVCAAHLLAFTVMMNVLTEHATCSVLFGLVGTVASVVLSLPKTSKDISWISIGSFFSILAAVMVVMISLDTTRPGGIDVKLINDYAELAPAFLGVLNMMLAYAGNAAFFNFVTELKNPRDFPKALFFLQSCAISTYIIVGTVIYYYVGSSVSSPALTSADPLIRKIAYGVALPTILVAGVINGHVATKQIYTSLWIKLRKPEVVYANTWISWGSWVACLVCVWTAAWVLAEAIPIFEQLLGLVSALFMAWFSYGLCGVMWIYMNWGMCLRGWMKRALFVLNVFMVILGAGACGSGLYASGLETKMSGASGRPFSCADSSPQLGKQFVNGTTPLPP